MKNYPRTSFLPLLAKVWTFERSEASKTWKESKDKLRSFCKPPAWWKTTQRHLLRKVEVLKSLNFWKVWKRKLCSFSKPLAWWKTTQRLLLTKVELLKALKSLKRQTWLILWVSRLVKNPKVETFQSFEVWKTWRCKLCSFCKPPVWWKLLKDLFWKRCGILKALKLWSAWEANFAHFVSQSLTVLHKEEIFFGVFLSLPAIFSVVCVVWS